MEELAPAAARSLADRDAVEIVATKAAPDLVCWLLPAVPPSRTGGVNVARIAEVLDVSRSTVYRWLKNADEREFEPDAHRILARYAVLRGHGGYLWPGVDPAIAIRHQAYLEDALAGIANLTRNPGAYMLAKSATTAAEVFTYHHPLAKVYGVAYATTTTNRRRILRGGATTIQSVQAPSVLHAKAIKYSTLVLAGDERCIAPRELIGEGRTEVWRQRAGQIDLAHLA